MPDGKYYNSMLDLIEITENVNGETVFAAIVRSLTNCQPSVGWEGSEIEMAPQTDQKKSENCHSKDICSEENKPLELLPASEIGTDFTYKHKVKWLTFTGYIVNHIMGLAGGYLILTLQVHPLTLIYLLVLLITTAFGVTMGSHRYFTHRSFKATTTVRRILLILFTITGQNSLWAWVRTHRQHHKYADTDADPHNARRGFWFSHIGWYLSYKNPKVFQYGKGIDMSDLSADSWIMFQRKYFLLCYLVAVIFIPSVIPIILWNENPWTAFFVCFAARTCISLNLTCLINSYAHLSGTKPYDKNILAGQNKAINLVVFGEGWHNFHHVFPWDYRCSELGTPLNLTVNLIDFCAKMGWVYDRKEVSMESIKNHAVKAGDNTHEKFGNATKTNM